MCETTFLEVETVCAFFAVALGCILAIRFVAPSAAEPQTRPKAASSCDHVELLSSHPLPALPKGTQDILQRSLRSKLLAITSDPKMGMSDADVAKARLKAIEIARPSKASALYVVAWEDNAFGVNGFNWIIEVKPSGATSLLSDRATVAAQKRSQGAFGRLAVYTKELRARCLARMK
jgi:hypothetical protein